LQGARSGQGVHTYIGFDRAEHGLGCHVQEILYYGYSQ
jgi:hypothetical protein